MSGKAVQVVEKFWELMGTNDFTAVGPLLSDDFVLEWPQSAERLRGRDNFAAMNKEYPAKGPWRFTVHSVVGDDESAVSDVSITDGAVKARAISFFSMKDGRIVKMIEFWPQDYPAPRNRKHLVERIEP